MGTVLFGGLAVYYGFTAWGHPSWLLLIAGPMVLLAVLYSVAWVSRRAGTV